MLGSFAKAAALILSTAYPSIFDVAVAMLRQQRCKRLCYHLLPKAFPSLQVVFSLLLTKMSTKDKQKSRAYEVAACIA